MQKKPKIAGTKTITPEVLPAEQKIAITKDKQISDTDIVNMYMSGMSSRKIEAIAGIDHATICRKIEKIKALVNDPERVRIFTEIKKAAFTETQMELLEVARNKKKQNKMSGKDAIVSVGILEDKITPKNSEITINNQTNILTQINPSALDD